MKLHKILSDLAVVAKGTVAENILLNSLPENVRRAIFGNSSEKLKKLISNKDSWLDHAAVPEMVIHQA